MKNKIIIIVFLLLLVVGCSSNKGEEIKSNGEIINTSKMEHKHCTRGTTKQNDMETNLSYDLYYTGEVLNLLKSEEKIISASDEKLTQYENAYKKIKEKYNGLEYYDFTVTRTDTTVTSSMVINYDKVDIERLLEIEGSEDNIIEDGVAKVDKWITLAKRFGTKCELVED